MPAQRPPASYDHGGNPLLGSIAFAVLCVGAPEFMGAVIACGLIALLAIMLLAFIFGSP